MQSQGTMSVGSGGGSALADTLAQRRRGFTVRKALRLMRSQPLATFGALLIIVFLFISVFGEVISPEGVNEVKPREARLTPSSKYWFGTDELGRDLFSRVILGAQIAVTVGVGGMLIAQVLAISVGSVSGFLGGKVDMIVQRLVDAAQSVPGIIVLLAVLTITGSKIVSVFSFEIPTTVIIVLGVFFSVPASRVIRSIAIALRGEMYVEAARSIGASNFRIILRHIIPNLLPVALVLASTQMGQMILAEAALSFLGVGIPPPTPSWGRMIADARIPAVNDPHLIIWPGLFLALFVFSWNVLGDGLRDVLDPRLRGSR